MLVILQAAFCGTPSRHERVRAPSHVLPIVFSTSGAMNEQELHPRFSLLCSQATQHIGGEDRWEGGHVAAEHLRVGVVKLAEYLRAELRGGVVDQRCSGWS
jgi:hypothetical protein